MNEPTAISHPPTTPPISLAGRRRQAEHASVRRTRTADDLLEQLGALCLMAAPQDIETVEVDWKDISALLLHVAALEAGLEWASQNHGCAGAGCRWPSEINRVMAEVMR